jgi:hypothetical protein
VLVIASAADDIDHRQGRMTAALSGKAGFLPYLVPDAVRLAPGLSDEGVIWAHAHDDLRPRRRELVIRRHIAGQMGLCKSTRTPGDVSPTCPNAESEHQAIFS